jgi:hypothetical protein
MYKLLPAIDGVEPNVVLRVADNSWIPMDPENRDYQEYLEWLAAGNEPLQPD